MTQTFGKKAHNASKLVEYLYQRPIVSTGEVALALDIAKTTAGSLIKDFEAKGVIFEITGYQRNKYYVFKKYLEIYSQS